MSTQGRRTSFFALTSDEGTNPDESIRRVEIPHFQRDYAQGREIESVRRIRTDFLAVLFAAVAEKDSTPVGLDFVYGAVDDGTLRPLDGQQRLTTLFLLHWYLGSRSGHLADDHRWQRFSYATRQSARMFCERLVEAPLPGDVDMVSEWITDQPWYLFLWRHDPTIQSMLVMIDAIHQQFRDVDASTAWARMTDPNDPAIWFLFEPLDGLGSGAGADMRPEDLYIKMNSRGKPLTEFENFKAHFEKTIASSPRAAEFALRVDTTWSDLMWHLRGDDDLIDDEFLRYMEFVTEICEWRDGRDDGAGQRLGQRTAAVFGDDNPQRDAHLEFLFQALDVFVDRAISDTFDSYFAGAGDDAADGTRVRLFFRTDASLPEALNLFETCCRSYGHARGRARVFSLGQSLVLYSVVLHLIEGTEEFPRRVRILRNLIEASADEIRPDRMPKILEDVHRVIRDGDLDDVVTLNQAQVNDETLKAAFLVVHPDQQNALFALEDHELLRGSLGAFEFDATSFERRSAAFESIMRQPSLWPRFLGALLAVGEYQRQRPNARPFLFGTDSVRHASAWRDLLTGTTRDRLQLTREVLATFLDLISATSEISDESLGHLTTEYLARCEARRQFDWRYYMVKYPAMRENGSSTYFAEPVQGLAQTEMGYSLCMLKPGGRALNGNYRDPYLLAISRELDEHGVVEDKWFNGYETEPRRLPLLRSATSVRCVAAGFELRSPPNDVDVVAFTRIAAELGADANGVVNVPQVDVDGRLVDSADRVQLGMEIVRRLVAASL